MIRLFFTKHRPLYGKLFYFIQICVIFKNYKFQIILTLKSSLFFHRDIMHRTVLQCAYARTWTYAVAYRLGTCSFRSTVHPGTSNYRISRWKKNIYTKKIFIQIVFFFIFIARNFCLYITFGSAQGATNSSSTINRLWLLFSYARNDKSWKMWQLRNLLWCSECMARQY